MGQRTEIAPVDGHGEMEINAVETEENGKRRKRNLSYILKLECKIGKHEYTSGTARRNIVASYR